MEPRKTNTYEIFPPAPDRPVQPASASAKQAGQPSEHLDSTALAEPDKTLLEACWELATRYHEQGRSTEAVEYYLVAAALFERAGQVPRRIYELVMELDSDNALAASRLDSTGVSGARAALFIQHVLSRHEPSQIFKILEDEKQRNWVTPPRGSQGTCPDCGMGVSDGQDVCSFCGAKLRSGYRKRSTAAYLITEKTRTLPRGVPVRPQTIEAPRPQEPPTNAPQTVSEAESGLTGRQGVVKLVGPDGKELASAPLERNDLLVGSDTGALGQDLPGLRGEAIRLSLHDDRISYHCGPNVPVYQVVHGTITCKNGQMVQTGGHLLRFHRDDHHLTVEILSAASGGTVALCRFASESVTVGRRGNDLDLPHDPYLAEHHIQVSLGDNGELMLTDLDTDSGTFLALPPEGTLSMDTVLRVDDLFLVLTRPE